MGKPSPIVQFTIWTNQGWRKLNIKDTIINRSSSCGLLGRGRPARSLRGSYSYTRKRLCRRMKRALTRPSGRSSSSPRTLTCVFLTHWIMWMTIFCLIKKKLLRRRRVLGRSRVLMKPKFRLPFVYFILFFTTGFWLYRLCNYENLYFSSMHLLSFDDKFCTIYVCLVCLCLCNAPLLVEVWIGHHDDKCGIFWGCRKQNLVDVEVGPWWSCEIEK